MQTRSHKKIRREDLYNRIIAKYPDYKAVPPDVLMDKWLKKYPEYKQVLLSEPPGYMTYGPMYRGMKAARRGVKLEDMPGVLGDVASGMVGDLPEKLARRPELFAYGGGFGVTGSPVPKERSSFGVGYPEPVTPEGKSLGEDLGTIASASTMVPLGVDVISGIRSAVPKIPSAVTNIKNLYKKGYRGAELSKRLWSAIQEARKVAGHMQGGYIDANPEEPVDPEKLNRIISDLPKTLQEEIASNMAIRRTRPASRESLQFVIPRGAESVSEVPRTDWAGRGRMTERGPMGVPVEVAAPVAPKTELLPPRKEVRYHPEEVRGPDIGRTVYGEEQIDPILKNAEQIRRIIKEKVPTTRWRFAGQDEPVKTQVLSAYDELGRLMSEGRPELADLFKDYAFAKGAEKQFGPRLVSTKTGLPKDIPITHMFGEGGPLKKGARSEDVLAIKRLSSQVPEILDVVEEATKYSGDVQRAIGTRKMLGKIGNAALYSSILGPIFYNVAKRFYKEPYQD